jgi:hypothetical protein
MKRLFSSLASFQLKKPETPATPQAQAIAEIEKSGGSARPIAQGDERLAVAFHLQGAAITDQHLAPLARLQKVVSLNLAKTAITDAVLPVIARHTGLTELHLELTKVTDAGLANLKSLQELEYLNLYGTAVTDAGLAHLASLPKLRNLYLWQTKVTAIGARNLKQALPNLEINMGWGDPPPPKP